MNENTNSDTTKKKRKPRKPPAEWERKPYKVIHVHDNYAPHGVKSDLVLRVYPNGLIEISEKRRKVRRSMQASAVYVRCIMRDIAQLPRRRRKR